MRILTVGSRSKRKRWGKWEWKELRRRARKDRGARQELRRKIKEARAECWSKCHKNQNQYPRGGESSPQGYKRPS